jgi:Autotransporter beta-domain
LRATHLTAGFSANNVAGRIEGGYRFTIPGVFDQPGFGFTPYAAFQMQAFRTPFYSEIAASGSSAFALDYSAHTTTTTRTELGAWFDRPVALNDGAILTLRTRAAWAHDNWSDTNMTAAFQSLAGSSFTVIGASARFIARLRRRGDQFQERDHARGRIRHRVGPALTDLCWYRTIAFCVVAESKRQVSQRNRSSAPAAAIGSFSASVCSRLARLSVRSECRILPLPRR